jgi:hypothetical protein
VGTLLGGLLALRLYRTQERNARNKETKAKEEQRDSKLMYLAFLVSGARRYALGMNNALNFWESELSNDPFVVPSEFLVSDNSVARVVENINQEEFYLPYVGRFAGKHLEIERMFLCIDSLHIYKEAIFSEWRLFVDGNQTLARIIANASTELIHELRDIQNKALIPEIHIENLVKIHTSFIDSQNDVERGPAKIAEKLFLPIGDYIDGSSELCRNLHLTRMYNVTSESYAAIMKQRQANITFKNSLVALKSQIERDKNVLFENSETLINTFRPVS